MDARAILTRQAFQGLFASAYGTLKVETTGFLSGETREKRTRKDFVAELAQACQKAKRTHKSVTSNDDEDKRIAFALNGEKIGGFHSHFHAFPILSEDDFEIIRHSYKNGIEILISLDRANRLTRLLTTPFFISGCFSDKGKKYRMDFRAYYLDFGENGEIGHKRLAEIMAPKRVLREYF